MSPHQTYAKSLGQEFPLPEAFLFLVNLNQTINNNRDQHADDARDGDLDR